MKKNEIKNIWEKDNNEKTSWFDEKFAQVEKIELLKPCTCVMAQELKMRKKLVIRKKSLRQKIFSV